MSTQKAEKSVPQKHSGLTRIIKAGGYSFKGMQSAWQSEAAFRQECLLALLLIPAFLLMDLSSMDRFMLMMATGFVLVTELLNSALESVVDRIGAEYHELSGKAKDIGSAAVFIALLTWGYAWLEVLFFS
jgi:diacylglycerol kinase (ATP)